MTNMIVNSKKNGQPNNHTLTPIFAVLSDLPKDYTTTSLCNWLTVCPIYNLNCLLCPAHYYNKTTGMIQYNRQDAIDIFKHTAIDITAHKINILVGDIDED